MSASCTSCYNVCNDFQRHALPCGHIYCLSCITRRCKLGVIDRFMVPAQCCKKEFPIDYVKQGLSAFEFTTYSRFMAEQHWSSRHLDSDREYAEAVKRLGWKQCPGCGIGVERISGCDHMRCRCGRVFNWSEH